MTPRVGKLIVLLLVLHLVVMTMILAQGLLIANNMDSIANSLSKLNLGMNGLKYNGL
jgi:hypothetical protein